VPRRLIVEADGGSRGNPGPAAYGALVRDPSTGEILVEIAEFIGTASNNVAEYRGAIAGLTAARDLDPEAQVEVRMDSKLVVEQLSGRWQVKHPDMKVLAKRALAVWPGGDVHYTWVPRERNKDADRLANEALDAAAKGLDWAPRDRREPAAGAATGVDQSAPGNRLVGWAHDLGEPTTLRLLRHGETVHTRQKRFSGAGGDDPVLSAEGLAQAAAAAAALMARGGVDVVVSSPLARASQTAAAAAAALGLTVEVDDDVVECAFGEWEGLTFAEVEQTWPDALAAWLGSTAVAPPGGESFDEVERRVKRAQSRILQAYQGKSVLVVSHVTPIKTLVRLALGAPGSSLYRMELSPASLTTLAWYADGTASMRSFNDVGHLDGLLDSLHI
jgi:ribonuclease H / adenosylcobalamin/alpha-ribazole phosphatase